MTEENEVVDPNLIELREKRLTFKTIAFCAVNTFFGVLLWFGKITPIVYYDLFMGSLVIIGFNVLQKIIPFFATNKEAKRIQEK